MNNKEVNKMIYLLILRFLAFFIFVLVVSILFQVSLLIKLLCYIIKLIYGKTLFDIINDYVNVKK